MGLWWGENFWLHLTTASAQCLRLSERFFILWKLSTKQIEQAQSKSRLHISRQHLTDHPPHIARLFNSVVYKLWSLPAFNSSNILLSCTLSWLSSITTNHCHSDITVWQLEGQCTPRRRKSMPNPKAKLLWMTPHYGSHVDNYKWYLSWVWRQSKISRLVDPVPSPLTFWIKNQQALT